MTERQVHPQTNRQLAPDPVELRDLVDKLKHRPRWSFALTDSDFERGQGSWGMTLVITITEPDAYHPERMRSVVHYMLVPPASFDRRSWRRWLLDQCRLVDDHEACEAFTIDGEKPYAPSHGPGNDPYMIREVGTVEDVETSFRGERKEATGVAQ